MKLSSVDFYLDWPVSIKLKNLREFIIANLEKKGDLIRWSIVDIQNSIDPFGTKKTKSLLLKLYFDIVFRHILNLIAKLMNLLQLLIFLA